VPLTEQYNNECIADGQEPRNGADHAATCLRSFKCGWRLPQSPRHGTPKRTTSATTHP
jgi:hypothetical protein